ncbi:MAG: hypothetical protein EXS01_01240 [Phycisphaerales bacterium]|nr:hypothetical protein [Phycisphaerales bacterium]
MSRRAPLILFTAFEPSGDAHAAPVIAALRGAHPTWRLVAWGGRRMEAAGAEMMGRTADDGTMGVPALDKILSIRRIAGEIDRFGRENPVAVHVPVDSPAANFPMCKRMKGRGARVVHLVAPQIWAWGPWRIRKLRRLTDHVICLLPFEEAWFRARGVPATFVGHPVMGDAHDSAESGDLWQEPEAGAPRVLILPGSRTIEVNRNSKLLLEVLASISGRYPNTAAVICAASPSIARRFVEVVGSIPRNATLMTGVIDRAVAWCDFAVGVSGTVSLDLTRAAKPMIGIYQTSALARIGANFMLRTPQRLLPNILAKRCLVPEFVPWSGSSAPIIAAALRMASEPHWRAEITTGLREIARCFEGHDPGRESAEVIARVAQAHPRS